MLWSRVDAQRTMIAMGEKVRRFYDDDDDDDCGVGQGILMMVMIIGREKGN